MNRQQLSEQQAFFNEEEGIPRRSTRNRQTDEEGDTRRSIGVIGKSALPYVPIGNVYVIKFTDGRKIQVTEHELADLPESYQRAARLVTPQVAVPKQRRQPQPKLPVQDDTVYEMPPATARETEGLPKQPRRRFFRVHWLVWVGLVMLTFVVGWIALTAFASWWQITQDDWHYGRPRTSQVDANVGHGTAQNPMSHFIAINLNGHIEIIEIAGNPTDSRVYIGPNVIGSDQQLTPVTLSFKDVNGDGKLDMIVQVSGSQFIYLNTGTGFKPAPNQ